MYLLLLSCLPRDTHVLFTEEKHPKRSSLNSPFMPCTRVVENAGEVLISALSQATSGVFEGGELGSLLHC